jgi:hypothetical protein
VSAPPDGKRRPLGKGNGALKSLAGGSERLPSYSKAPRPATLTLQTVFNDDGHFLGLEAVNECG